MAQRRYDEDEIREILARATELGPDAGGTDASNALLPAPDPGPGRGLTLAELEDVGSQAGILPARIAEAAAEMELARSLAPAVKKYMGVSLTAGHVVGLPRLLTEDEWDRFVVRLRDTFGATGTVRTEGSLQTWSNGHLKVLLEPLSDGARLRFQALDNDSKSFIDGGVASGASAGILAAALGVLVPLSGKPIPLGFVAFALGIGAFGAGMWAYGRARAAAWMPTREAQFRALGAEARRIAGTDPAAGGSSPQG
jgi:hypothetical protein